MKTRRLLTLALATLVACGGSKPTPTPGPSKPDDQVTTGTTTTTATPSDDEVLPLWPSVKKGTLPNGLTYYILKHGKPENRALLWLAVNAGATQEDEDQRGLAHFAEHMAFNGTKRFPKAEVVGYLERIGMRFGPDLNAYTSFDETVYQLEVPTDNKEYVGKGLDILRDWAGDIAFDAPEVEKERGVVLEEWRLGRGANERVFDKQVKVLFQGSRYADRLPIGKPEIIKGAPREALTRFYKDWYRPNLMAVIAVGDVDIATLEKEITARFSDLKNPAKQRERVKSEVPKATGTRVSIESDKELPTTSVQVTNVFPHRSERTVKEFRRIIAEQIYGQILNERLATLARRKESPFSGAGVGVSGFVREVDAFSRTAQVKAGRTEDTLKALFTEVLRVEKHGFTQGELERARTNIARYYESIAAEESTSSSREFTSEITRNFFEGEFMIGRKAERDYTLKFLPTITIEELDTLVKTFGGAENRVIMIAGPDPKVLPSEKRVLQIVDEVNKTQIEPWQEKAAATALMTQPPKPGKVTKETKTESIGVTEWTLSNGVRVIVKPTDFEAEQVSVSGDSPGGLAVATGKNFNHARFADDVAGIGGVGELDDDSLDKVLTGKRIQVSASIGDTTESIDASASTKDLETMFQLLHLRMTAPRKDEEAFAVWKANLSEALTNQLRVPDVQYAIQSQEVMFKGHVRRKVPTAKDIEAIDQDKALAFYKDRFGDASDFTFVIVGQVELDKLKPMVETYLASLPAKGRKEKEKDAGVRRVGGTVKKQWALGTEPKARVQVAFHGDEAWTRDKDRDMFILGQVMSIRLREILREDMGGVYGVGASGFLTRVPRGERMFSIQFGAAPEAVDKLIKAALDEAAVIAKNGIGADYLEKVKQAFLRERETSLRTNGFWVGWLSNSARFKDDPTLILDPSKMVARMTSDNVKAAAKRYLSTKRYFQAVMVPSTTAPAAPAKPEAAAPKPAPAPAPAPKK